MQRILYYFIHFLIYILLLPSTVIHFDDLLSTSYPYHPAASQFFGIIILFVYHYAYYLLLINNTNVPYVHLQRPYCYLSELFYLYITKTKFSCFYIFITAEKYHIIHSSAQNNSDYYYYCNNIILVSTV